MRISILAAGFVLAATIPAVAVGQPLAAGTSLGCDHLVTVKQDVRAAKRIYAGTRKVTLQNLRRLGMMERCQHDPSARSFARSYNRRLDALHKARVHIASNPLLQTMASWYDDAGTTASGWHAYYGVATCGNQLPVCYPFGTKITFYYSGHTVVAVVDDHGPYANGAGFDLNQNVKAALGFDGVKGVQYRIG